MTAIRELIRVTRPGGVVALREMDILSMTAFPASEELDRFKEILIKQIDSAEVCKGGRAGRTLKSWCRAAGAVDARTRYTAGTWCWSSSEDREAWGGSWALRVTESEFATKAVKMGLASKEELGEIRKAWEALVQDEDAWFGVMHGEALVTI